MSAVTGGRGPALHPLEVIGAPRRRYVTALVLQLCSTAGLSAAATGLLVPTRASQLLLLTGALLFVIGWVAGRRYAVTAWSGLPAPRGPRAMPVTADRRYTLAAAMLLGGTAVILSPLGPAGAFLAVMIGLDAALAAADSYRRLDGRDPYPARRVPALLGVTAVSWTAAATVGGLGALGVLLWSLTVTALAAGGYGLILVVRPARSCRPAMSKPVCARLLAWLTDVLAASARCRDGVARQSQGNREDDLVVVYTTSRVLGGPHDGKFLVQLYWPVGKGARRGDPQQWQEAWRRQCSPYRAARKRATELYLEHSRKMATCWADAGQVP